MSRFGLAGFALVIAMPLATTAPRAEPGADAPQQAHADTVFINGRIFTADSFASIVEGVAIADGKFQRVGTNAEVREHIGPGTKLVDLKGKMAMPGITDMHVHAVRGGLAEQTYCKFAETDPLDRILATIGACAAAKQPGEWVEGAAWNSLLAPTLDKAMLDRVAPNNPVYLHDNTNHVVWVNSAALAAAGVDRTTVAPRGGTIIRHPQTGEATGVLLESAMGLIFNAKPKADHAAIVRASRWIFGKLNAYGVTSIQSAQASAEEVAAFRELEATGSLTVRVKANWDFNTALAPAAPEAMLERFDSREERGARTALIDPDGAKIYADGIALGAGSPYLEPYAFAPTFGHAAIDQSELRNTILRMDALGLSILIHAMGDAAVRNTLDAIEAARRANGTSGRRHIIAHTFSVDPADRGRAARLDVVFENSPPVVLFPNDLMAGAVELLGRERVRQVAPLRSLIEAGDTVAYGSDWDNIPEPDPWLALQAMVTRQNPAEPQRGYVARQEAVDLITALEILTINGAVGLGLEKQTGSIEPGKDADMIVLDQNLFAIPADRIHRTKVLQTLLRGNLVYVTR